MTRIAPVRLEAEGDVGVIVIDSPPANALSAAVRIGLIAAVADLAANPALHAGVLLGANGSFISGADIGEFSGPVVEPALPAVVTAFERCPKPIVAAIEGVALGGGLEVALGCDARIALVDATMGLPEVTLGIIPGAGGTQRLARIVGIPQAMTMIASGRRVAATEGARLGIIDAIASAPLRASAIAAARILTAKRRLSELPLPATSAEEIAAATAEQTKRARSLAARVVIDIVGLAATLPFAEAVERERQAFLSLRQSEEATALRYLFFAERAARKVDGGGERARPIASVGIVGAGTMGSGIAAAFAAAGMGVTIYDAAAEARDRGAISVRSALVDLGKPDAVITFAAEPSALANADLLVEAVFEDVATKAAVMRQLGAIAQPHTVLATNTSYLDLDALARASGRPERTLGLHFFAPAHRMKLLEVVRGVATAPATLAAGLDVARRLGKVAVIAAAGEGFIGNRIFAKYRAQAEFLLEEGVSPREVDAAAEALGFAMGPFAVADLSGLDIAWRLRRSKDATRDPRERYVAIPDRICDMGRLGRKTGAGWYDYGDGGRGRDAPDVAAAIAALRPKRYRGATADAATIQARLLGAIVNEAANVLADGVARAPGDIDVVFVNGYGYSRLKGGPLFQASRRPRHEVAAMADAAAAATGFGFRRGDLSLALEVAASVP